MGESGRVGSATIRLRVGVAVVQRAGVSIRR